MTFENLHVLDEPVYFTDGELIGVVDDFCYDIYIDAWATAEYFDEVDNTQKAAVYIHTVSQLKDDSEFVGLPTFIVPYINGMKNEFASIQTPYFYDKLDVLETPEKSWIEIARLLPPQHEGVGSWDTMDIVLVDLDAANNRIFDMHFTDSTVTMEQREYPVLFESSIATVYSCGFYIGRANHSLSSAEVTFPTWMEVSDDYVPETLVCKNITIDGILLTEEDGSSVERSIYGYDWKGNVVRKGSNTRVDPLQDLALMDIADKTKYLFTEFESRSGEGKETYTIAFDVFNTTVLDDKGEPSFVDHVELVTNEVPT